MDEFACTRNNYFKFGYERPLFEGSDQYVRDEPFGDRKTQHDKWWVNYGRCERHPDDIYNWRVENSITAKMISEGAEKIGKIPMVMFSGGIDSEVVVRSFMDAAVRFEVAIIVFENHLNLHDIAFAISFCVSHGIRYHIRDFNLIDFWKEKAPDSEKTYLETIAGFSKTFSPQLNTTICASYLAPDEYLPVIGSGEPHLVYRGEKWCLSEKERIASFYRASIGNNSPMVPAFFQYNPENIYAFLTSNDLREYFMLDDPYYTNSSGFKFSLYRMFYPDLVYRQKYTGFELVQDEDHIYREGLKRQYLDYDDVVEVPVERLLNDLQRTS